MAVRRWNLSTEIYAGSGGSFPIHADSDESVDARRLTAILYLSDPAWQQHWGGQLRLYPVTGPPVDVLPSQVISMLPQVP